MTRHLHHFNHRHLPKTQNRIGTPFASGHGITRALGRNLLKHGATGGLHHVAMDLMLNARRINRQARIVSNHHAFDMNLTRAFIDVDIGDPSSPRRTEPWPLAVNVASPGNTLAMQNIAIPALLLWLVMHFPTRFSRRCL